MEKQQSQQLEQIMQSVYDFAKANNLEHLDIFTFPNKENEPTTMAQYSYNADCSNCHSMTLKTKSIALINNKE